MLLYAHPPGTKSSVNSCGWPWSATEYSTFPNHQLAFDRGNFTNGTNVLEDLPGFDSGNPV